MSSAGNRDLIERLEAVGLDFTGYWSSSLTLRCGLFYFNPDLPNDIFFDKLTCVSCIDDEILQESLGLFEKYRTTPYIYTLNRPDLEEKLIKKNFRLYDTQHVLVKRPNNTETPKVSRISSKDSVAWSKLFCEAYDCADWLDSVNDIVKKSSDSIEYYIDESRSSCVALYEKKSLLGLYCLGTVPSMRNKGHAASLIDFALDEVKRRGLEFLMLETYHNDKLIDFYLNVGFEEVYKKNIYTI